MSIKLVLNVIKQCKHKPSEKLMLTVLAEFASDKGRCYPSFETLAGRCNVSTRQAQNIVYKLIQAGDISASRREGGSNIYQFLRYIEGYTHETHFVPSPTQFSATHEIDFVPPTKFLQPTHEILPSQPTKPISYEPVIIEPNTEPKDKSIVAPDGGNTAPKISIDRQTIVPEGKTSQPIPVTSKRTPPPTLEGVATSIFTPQIDSVNKNVAKTQPPPIAPPRSDHYRMTGAIVDAFGWNFKTMTKSNKSLVGKIAKDLLEASATPDQIPDLYAFCKQQNWSGGFTPGALASQWANFCATQSTSSGEIFPVWTPPPGYVGVKFDYPPPLVDPNNPDEDDPYAGLTTAQMREKFNQLMNKMVANMTIEETPIPDDDPLKEVLLW